MKLSEITLRPPKILIFGSMGSGKTALACTLGDRAEVFDFDGGLSTCLHLKDVFTETRKQVEVVGEGYVDLDFRRPKAYTKFRTDLLDRVNQMAKGTYKYKAIIIDSLTALFDRALNQVCANSGLARITDAKDPRTYWNLAFTEVLEVFQIIRGLPVVVVMTAHDNRDTLGEGTSKKDIIEIAIPGKNMPDKVGRYFDEVWYMKTRPGAGGKTEFTIQTKLDTIVRCRSNHNLEDNLSPSLGLVEILKRAGYAF